MRVVFFGTPEFAVASLEKLISNNVNVVAAVTAPDKLSGRGLHLTFSAVKQYCIDKSVRVLQPTNLKDEIFLEELKNLNADIQIVVAFRMLPEHVWNMPLMGTYNLHASLLPKYRGAAPINWCIIKGEKETGVTTFKLQHQIDTGSILLNEKVEITKEMNAGQLHDLLMNVGAALLLKSVQMIEESFNNGVKLEFIAQDESLVSHAPKIFKEDCLINWHKPVVEVYNFIRGLSPHPGAYSNLKNLPGKDLNFKIYKSNYIIEKHVNTNGFLSTDNINYIKVYCHEGYLELEEIQLEGKRRMLVKDFLRGYTILKGAVLN